MPRVYRPYIPQTLGDLLDLPSSMLLSLPSFVDKTGYFPERNLETTFAELNEGLLVLRLRLGEERYGKLLEMASRARAYFEADPEEKTGDSLKGRELILDMEDLVKAKPPKK